MTTERCEESGLFKRPCLEKRRWQWLVRLWVSLPVECCPHLIPILSCSNRCNITPLKRVLYMTANHRVEAVAKVWDLARSP